MDWFDDQNFYGPFDLDWWTKPMSRPGARVTMGSIRFHESLIKPLMEMLMPTVMLSEHFTLAEFLISETASRMGISNEPSADDLENLTFTAGVMEEVRKILGDVPITITSGYRGPALNAAVGGSSTSAHMFGLACDFIVPGFGDPRDVCNALQPYMDVLGIDQLILEYGDWTHLGLVTEPSKPRCQCLTIDNSGTRSGFA